MASLDKTILLSHIVAASKNGVISHQGKMPWHIPEDLRFFHKKTSGHSVIMGRKTFEAIGKPLKNRFNVILTRQKQTTPLFSHPHIILTSSLKAAIQKCMEKKNQYGSEIFIIGGGEIYQQSLSLVNRIYLTLIDKNLKGDTFYPPIDLSQFKKIEETCGHWKTNQPTKSLLPAYSFLTYERKKKNKHPSLSHL